MLPDRFFGELRGRFGNQYNVQDVGQDGVVEEVLYLCMYTYINKYIHTHTHTHVFMYIYIYMHTYIHINIQCIIYMCV